MNERAFKDRLQNPRHGVMHETIFHTCFMDDPSLWILNDKACVWSVVVHPRNEFFMETEHVVFQVPLKDLNLRCRALAAPKFSPRHQEILD